MRCEDCFNKLSENTKCTIKAYGCSDFEKTLCPNCTHELLVTQGKHFYCKEYETKESKN